MGDFNTPDIDWYTLSVETGFSLHLCSLIFQYNFTIPQMNMVNLLDLIITNNEDIISEVQVHNKGTLIKSDHFLVSFNLKSFLLHHNSKHQPINILDYSKANYNGLNEFLCTLIFLLVLIWRMLNLCGLI